MPLRHYGLIENGFAIGERMGLTASDRVFVSVPLFWAYGAVNALPATLTHGGTMVLQAAFEPAGALELIERHRCTAIYTLPNMTAALLEADRFAPERVESLRTGLTLGSPAEIVRVAEELGVERICNIYGGTETYGNCCVTPCEWPLERRAESQGPPLPGVAVRIADQESGAELAPGEVGEIEVRGYLAAGYLGDETGAGSAFGEDGWFRTGDLGSLDQEGALHFGSRASEMIKTGGINVAPREVEEFLGLHPGVAATAVVGVEDEAAGEVVVAFVVAADAELTRVRAAAVLLGADCGLQGAGAGPPGGRAAGHRHRQAGAPLAGRNGQRSDWRESGMSTETIIAEGFVGGREGSDRAGRRRGRASDRRGGRGAAAAG